MKSAIVVFFAACACLAVAGAAYDIGKEMETEGFWKSDPVLFVKRHQDQGFKFTSGDRSSADTRLDGAVTYHGIPVFESKVAFAEDSSGITRVELVLFSPAGTEMRENVDSHRYRLVRRDKDITYDGFVRLMRDVRGKLTAEGAKNPQMKTERTKAPVVQKSQTWPRTDIPTETTLTWNYSQEGRKTDTFKAGFVRLARDMAVKQQAKEDAEQLNQLLTVLATAIPDWSSYAGLDKDALWQKLTEEAPEIAGGEKFRDALLKSAAEHVAAAEKGETLPPPAEAEAGAETVSETLADYQYFAATDALIKEEAEKNAAYEELNRQLVAVIPDLGSLSGKLQTTLRENIEKVLWLEDNDFSARYNAYLAHQARPESAGAWKMSLASLAQTLLLAGVAVLLLGLVVLFWKPLTERFGVPRTIIALFFVYLCLLAELYDISVRMMLGNVLERMTMYGVLVLAMMPGIQCGIGLNMGMTIGCISGLLGIVMVLQFNMVGFPALLVACVIGALVSLPLGWAYSKLLNRMKGNEMTISTYVGFSFVSLMCIAWMMLPFNNPKIIWLLSGKGLRVTHSLLGSFAHLLDNFLAFKVFGVKVPTGGLLFLGLCCLGVWLFSRSRLGIAMTAAGSNSRFAEASGINVNHMRTVGTVLSTIIAAVGIVIYSQAFGYAQLYTAPRQLGFIASSAILIGGATVSKAKVSHVLIGVFLFEGVLVFGQQIANSVVAGGGLSEVMRIMISNGIILYALTQSGGGRRA